MSTLRLSQVDEPPILDEEDEIILDDIWDSQE